MLSFEPNMTWIDSAAEHSFSVYRTLGVLRDCHTRTDPAHTHRTTSTATNLGRMWFTEPASTCTHNIGVRFGFVRAALLPAVGTCVVLAFGVMPGRCSYKRMKGRSHTVETRKAMAGVAFSV